MNQAEREMLALKIIKLFDELTPEEKENAIDVAEEICKLKEAGKIAKD